MVEKNDILLEVTDRFNRIIRKFTRMDKWPRDYGTGKPLSHSQIHFIAFVGQAPLNTVTKLGRLMGVTKGSVSQLATKLAREGYITKLHTLANNKEVQLALTKKGETARAGHDEYHRNLYERYWKSLTVSQIRDFNAVLKKIEAYTDEYLNGL
jgi:DNA-binding MarR family transcriptional regulator